MSAPSLRKQLDHSIPTQTSNCWRRIYFRGVRVTQKGGCSIYRMTIISNSNQNTWVSKKICIVQPSSRHAGSKVAAVFLFTLCSKDRELVSATSGRWKAERNRSTVFRCNSMHRTLRPLGASTLTLLLLVLQVFRLFRMLTLAKSTQSPTPRQFFYRTDSKQITWEKNTIGRFPLTELVKSLAFRGFLPGFLLGISWSVSIVSGLLDLWYLVGETWELLDVTDLNMAISKTRISSRAIVVAIGNTMVVANPPNWNSPTILQQHWFKPWFSGVLF